MNSLGHSPRSRLWGGERGKLQPGSHLPGSCRRRDGGGDWLGPYLRMPAHKKPAAIPTGRVSCLYVNR